MPLTPFHLGPASTFGLIFNRYINLTTFLIANIIIDIEPFLILFLGLNFNLHGFLHSFLGGGIIATLLSLIIIIFAKKIQKINLPGIKQNFSKKAIVIASFSGIYLHILFDSPLYKDIKPFYPSSYNPFYGVLSASIIYNICIVLFIAAVLIYIFRKKD